MKKRYIAVMLSACMMLSGCTGETESSTTPDVTGSQPEESEVTSTTESTAEKTRGTIVITTPVESVEESSVPDEPTSEATVEAVDESYKYAQLITNFDNEYLGLPQKDKIYIFESTGSTEEIGGALCYCVTCHDEYEGEKYYMCDFYISEDGTTVYRYYDSTGEYVLLPEAVGYPAFDPAVQTPEEVFGYSQSLYNLFFGRCDDKLDRSAAVVMDDGYTYYPIIDEQLDTMNELLDAMNKYFSNELMNSYMETGYIISSADGGLLRRTGHEAVYPEVCGDTTYELTSLTEDTAVYVARTPFLAEDDGMGSVTIDGTEPSAEIVEYTFTAEKQYGVWRFTSYEDVMMR